MKIFHFYSEVFVEFTIIVIFVYHHHYHYHYHYHTISYHYHQFMIVSCCFIVLKMSKKQVQETKCVFIHVLIIPFIIFYCVRNKAKQANKVRRVDRRTNALPNRQTNRPTDGHSQLQRRFVAPKKSNASRSNPKETQFWK